jgi:hypothetical protein
MVESADKIRDLCSRMLDCKDDLEQFQKASNELREALHDRLEELRAQVAQRARRTASQMN